MLGKTHHVGGTVAALIAFEVMRKEGLLIPDCNEFVQLLMMYPFVSFGSVMPDLDQNDDALPSKDPVAIIIHKFLKMTGAKHRSWQTHSLLVTGGFCALMFAMIVFLNSYVGMSSIEWAFLRLAVIGFSVGIASHLLLDALSMQGVHIWPGFKMRFVPKKKAFSTGGTWEKIVFWVLTVVLILLLSKVFIWDLLVFLKEKEIDSMVINKIIEFLKTITQFKG